MPNPVFTYILNIRLKNTFCIFTQLNDLADLFLRIQFKITQSFKWFQVLEFTNNSIKY